jgi:hypothetical protein
MARERLFVQRYLRVIRCVGYGSSPKRPLAVFSEMAGSPWLFRAPRMLPTDAMFWVSTTRMHQLVFQKKYVCDCQPYDLERVIVQEYGSHEVSLGGGSRATDQEVDAWWESVLLDREIKRNEAKAKADQAEKSDGGADDGSQGRQARENPQSPEKSPEKPKRRGL